MIHSYGSDKIPIQNNTDWSVHLSHDYMAYAAFRSGKMSKSRTILEIVMHVHTMLIIKQKLMSESEKGVHRKRLSVSTTMDLFRCKLFPDRYIIMVHAWIPTIGAISMAFIVE